MASATRHYLYRCTTDKLPEHLDRIEDAGDAVLWPIFVGGRDWILLCHTAVDEPCVDFGSHPRGEHGRLVRDAARDLA